MRSHKIKASNTKRNGYLLLNILVHSFTTLTCVSLCSYLFSLPFLFISLPRFLVNAKTLFLAANLILFFLTGGFGFRGASSRPSPVTDLYDEYVERSKRIRGMHLRVSGVNGSNRQDEQEEERALEVRPGPAEDEFREFPTDELVKDAADDDLQDPKTDQGHVSGQLPEEEPTGSSKNDQRDQESGKGCESNELPKEELTRRVEEFIARVNKRRWLESRSIVVPRI